MTPVSDATPGSPQPRSLRTSLKEWTVTARESILNEVDILIGVNFDILPIEFKKKNDLFKFISGKNMILLQIK